MKINELINDFEIWTTNEEKHLLEKLRSPKKLSHLAEKDQFRVQTLIRKSLVTKVGFNEDPYVVTNEQ